MSLPRSTRHWQSKVIQPKYKPVFRVSSKARKKYFPAEYDEHDIESVIQDLLEGWAREHNPDFTKE